MAFVVACVACASTAACSGWTPSRPFDREAPAVVEAIAALDGGDASTAAAKLEEYLSTGPCKDGSIGTPDLVRRRPDGTFDLGLALFKVGEQFGRRFGEEEVDAGVSEAARAQRHAQVTCARQIVQAVADDRDTPSELRARADYLDGNLAFLDGEYEDAVRAYDRALVISPGALDGGDPVGRDAAWNRAIALRRIDDRKDAGPDASQDGGRDAQSDASSGDGGSDASDRPKEDGGADAAQPPHPDAGDDGGGDGATPPPPEEPDAAPEPPREAGAPPPSTNEDERMLDQLENAPTLQEEQAKRGSKRHVRGMADK
jgi:hypothetical protein